MGIKRAIALLIAFLLCLSFIGCTDAGPEEKVNQEQEPQSEAEQPQQEPKDEPETLKPVEEEQKPAPKPEEKTYPTPEEVGPHTIPQELVEKESKLPIPTAEKLPSNWRGFNLNNKQSIDRSWSNKPYQEWQVKAVSDFGFNFLRIAIDYRTWLINADCNKVNVEFLENELDQLIGWGLKYDVHIQLDMHIGPGHESQHAAPKDERVLWKDESAQEDFARMWAMLARRYKGIPNQKLTFNLLNEPHDISNEEYVAVMLKAIEAVRKEDPDRLMIVDGNSYTTVPLEALAGIPNVAQAMHMYEPFNLTHYRASWVSGSGEWPVPTWPVISIPTTIKGVYHSGAPLTINGNFDESEVTLRVGTVSGTNDLVVLADGKEVYRKNFVNTGGEGEWKEVHYVEEWNVYQNVYDKDYSFTLPGGTKKIEIKSTTDWLTVTDITIAPKDPDKKTIRITPNDTNWNSQQVILNVDKDGIVTIDSASAIKDKQWVKETRLDPWLNFSKEHNVGFYIGEWGVHQFTPHDVTLRYIEDMIDLFHENGIGWALWNLNGSFGIIDSGRPDVKYEDYEGHKLDRKMLEILQKYND